MATLASGILYRVRSTGAVLLLQRGPNGPAPGTWCPPGGKREQNESAEQTAVREATEEAGPKAKRAAKNLRLLTRRVEGDVDFTTFLAEVDEPFDVELDDESTAFTWASPAAPPEPLHPGARVAIAKIDANELDVARMMVAGDLTSPQVMSNVMLLDIRITGTGVSYRQAHDEYCLRLPENYLNEDFLARCNGLPVLWGHPEKATLDSREWADRAVGTVFLPYVKNDEVWGIAKIYDDWAIDQLTDGRDWSTSPTVDFGAGVVVKDVNKTMIVKDENGNDVKWLVEGEPALLDHVALCANGVWDKGGPANGVNIARADAQMADEDKKDDAAKADQAKADQAKADQARKDAEDERWARMDASLSGISKIADAVASLSARVDAWDEEKKSDKRKDSKKADEDAEAEKANEAAREPGAGDDGEVERKAKKADGEDDEMADKKKDAKKSDADEDKDKKDDAAAKADARADAAERENAALKSRLDGLERRFESATSMTDADYALLAGAQARADAVYTQFGKQAPRPQAGETAARYRRRVFNELKTHSKEWKDIDPSKFDSPSSFEALETRVYADALTAAHNPTFAEGGDLLEVRLRDQAGRERIEFRGTPSMWLDAHKQQPMRARFARPAFRN